MASTSVRIEFPAPKTSAFFSAFNKAEKRTNDFRESVTANLSVGRSFLSTFSMVGNVVTGAFFAARMASDAFRSSFESTIGSAARFQSSLLEIKGLGVETSIEILRQRIRGLTAEFGQDRSATIKAYYDAISAGRDSYQVMAASAKAATVANTDLSIAVDLSTTVLNAYGAASSLAFTAMDQLIAIVQQGKTTIPELARSLGMVLPSAAAMRVSLAEVGAAIAALTSSGMQTSVAITSLRAVLSNISKPTKEAAIEAERLGVDFSLAGIRARGLAGFLEDLRKRSGGSVESVRALFGSVEAFNAAALLASEDGGKKFTDALEAIQSSSGGLDKSFDSFRKSAQFTLSRLGQAVVNFGESIGKTLLPAITIVANLAMDLIGDLTDHVERNSVSISDAITEFARRADNWLRQVLPDAANTLVEKFQELYNWLKDDLLNAADSFAGDVGNDLDSVAGAADDVSMAFDKMAGAIGRVRETVEWALQPILTIRDAIAWAGTKAGEAAYEFNESTGAIDRWAATAKGALDLLIASFDSDAWVKGFENFRANVKRDLDLFVNDFKATYNSISEWFSGIPQGFSTLFGTIYGIVSNEVGSLVNFLERSLQSIVNFFMNLVDSAGNLARQFGDIVADQFGAVGETVDWLTEKFREAFGASIWPEYMQKLVTDAGGKLGEYAKLWRDSTGNIEETLDRQTDKMGEYVQQAESYMHQMNQFTFTVRRFKLNDIGGAIDRDAIEDFREAIGQSEKAADMLRRLRSTVGRELVEQQSRNLLDRADESQAAGEYRRAIDARKRAAELDRALRDGDFMQLDFVKNRIAEIETSLANANDPLRAFADATKKHLGKDLKESMGADFEALLDVVNEYVGNSKIPDALESGTKHLAGGTAKVASVFASLPGQIASSMRQAVAATRSGIAELGEAMSRVPEFSQSRFALAGAPPTVAPIAAASTSNVSNNATINQNLNFSGPIDSQARGYDVARQAKLLVDETLRTQRLFR